MQENVPGKIVYLHIIAARVRMDMKIAFGEVKEQLKKLFPVKAHPHTKGSTKSVT